MREKDNVTDDLMKTEKKLNEYKFEQEQKIATLNK